MAITETKCAAPGCDATHKSWVNWDVTCVHCGAFVCRDDYRDLPVVELFMTHTRECPDCQEPMEE